MGVVASDDSGGDGDTNENGGGDGDKWHILTVVDVIVAARCGTAPQDAISRSGAATGFEDRPAKKVIQACNRSVLAAGCKYSSLDSAVRETAWER